MKEGHTVLASFPQADGRMKDRPALVLRVVPPFYDLLVCGISTQLQHCVEGFDDIISAGDPDFRTSGLVRSSLIRLGYLLTQPRKEFVGSIGHVSSERHRRLLARLGEFLPRVSRAPANVFGLIPARYASTRFPGKPLHPIDGKALLQHVVERCKLARSLSEVIVATDDARIRDAAQKFCRVEMTRPD